MPIAEHNATALPDADEKGRYTRLLLRDFHALERLIEEDRFERGVHRIGAELELNLLNAEREPALIGDEIQKALDDPQIDTEFSRFNLEINAQPAALEGKCFSNLQSELQGTLDKIRAEAARRDCSLLLSGIIPTLNKSHISPDALTPKLRYKALYDLRRALKGEQYEYRIRGVDELLTRDNIALFAGCVTSYQAHLQIDLDRFVDSFNWAQLLSAPLLACATYSPLFLGKRLWHETRVALFEQAADTRNPDGSVGRRKTRVFFGDNWLLDSPLELFKEDIAAFEPLFTLSDAEDPQAALDAGRAPSLGAWNAFNGSLYRWNRVCYGAFNGRPGLRIENRILPSGPTVVDMVANAAFWTGAMVGLPERYRDLPDKLDFARAKENFFAAARHGLGVSLAWPGHDSLSARELILEELIPIARDGLAKTGVDAADAERYLGIVEARVSSGKTGSRWMMDSYSGLLKSAKRDEALTALTSGIIDRQEAGDPVHTWQPVSPSEAGDWKNRYNAIHKIMSTELYKVGVDDVVELAAHIMEWKRVGHIPVEDDHGRLAGVITKDSIINYMINQTDHSEPTRVGDLMVRDPLTVGPDLSLADAVKLILENEVSCLPVISEDRLVGIVTERDFVETTRGLMEDLEAQSRHDR